MNDHWPERIVVREALDGLLALIRELEDHAIEWRAGSSKPLAESAAHVAVLIGRLGDCKK